MTTQDNPTNYVVILLDYGTMKINVIKEVRDEASLSLRESKDLVESAPSIVKANLSEIEAKALKARLEKHGAAVRVGRRRDSQHDGTDVDTIDDSDGGTTDSSYRENAYPDYNTIIDTQLDRIKSLWKDRNSWVDLTQGDWTWKKRERFEMWNLLIILRESTATDIDDPSSTWSQLLDIYTNPKVTDPFNVLKEAGGVSPAHLAETRNRIARILNIESPFTEEEGKSASK